MTFEEAMELYKEFTYHGGPFDRGSADKYYGRPYDPHKYPHGTHKGKKVTKLTKEELKAYEAAYILEPDRKYYE